MLVWVIFKKRKKKTNITSKFNQTDIIIPKQLKKMLWSFVLTIIPNSSLYPKMYDEWLETWKPESKIWNYRKTFNNEWKHKLILYPQVFSPVFSHNDRYTCRWNLQERSSGNDSLYENILWKNVLHQPFFCYELFEL